jgi:hypothetical protein
MFLRRTQTRDSASGKPYDTYRRVRAKSGLEAGLDSASFLIWCAFPTSIQHTGESCACAF